MRVIVQRTSQAEVSVDGASVGKIGKGMLVFLGVAKNDTEVEADYLVQKVSDLRIFEDDAGKMNLSARQTDASFLVVSQFTIYGDCNKGRRPSFDKAADPQTAQRLYEYFVEKLQAEGFVVETGQFQAMMDVSLVNDGPVTFILESK